MSQISILNLSFAYDKTYDNIFENVSFQIDTNWKLGFTGRNGRGKTTFLNLLLKKYEYTGSISTNVNFEYFPYPVNDKEINTLALMRCICKNAADWEIIREVSLLDVDSDVLDHSFSTLSNGEQTKVLLAALFLTSNSFLLIDEPTNHLDMEARAVVGRYLNKKHGFILVSHDRYLLDTCVDHILSINKTNIEIQKGNFSSYWQNKKQQDELEIAQDLKLRSDIKRLSSAAKQASNWSFAVEKTKNGTSNSGSKLDKGHVGHMAAKMMKRSKNIESRRNNALSEKKLLLKNIEISDSLKITPLKYHKDVLLSLLNISLFYDYKAVFSKMNLEIKQGDRVAMLGKNGCGKSSLIKLICGDNIKYTGTIDIGNNLIISYVSQDTSHLSGTLNDYAASYNIDESLFKAILRKLDFDRVQFEKQMQDYSSGQKKKILIARSLCEQAHLYIWDEPLNFIDVYSREQIEELLITYQPTILFVEHDKDFFEKIATKTITL